MVFLYLLCDKRECRDVGRSLFEDGGLIEGGRLIKEIGYSD